MEEAGGGARLMKGAPSVKTLGMTLTNLRRTSAVLNDGGWGEPPQPPDDSALLSAQRVPLHEPPRSIRKSKRNG